MRITKAHIIRTTSACISALLLGSTIATAYDLAEYPGTFVTDGKFDGLIVLGSGAQVTDVIGAIDIAAGLQADSTTKTPLSNAAYLSGDVKSIFGGKLQLRKKVSTMLTGKDLKAFATGTVSNARGTTAYTQVLRFGSTGLNGVGVNYVENEDDTLKDFAVINDGAPFLEWELQFTDGFESERESDGNLKDFEDKSIALMGAPATIVTASIDEDGTNLEMTLMSGSVGDTLREGESRTYSVDGKDYEVTLVFVSDPNTGDAEAKFSVNGEMTDAMVAGDTDRVAGTRFGVREILVNSREGVASFYLGAHDVQIEDPTPRTEDFDGTVEIDDESIEEGQVQVMGYFQSQNATYRMAWLKYRLEADAKEGSTIYIGNEDHTLRPLLDEPEGFLSEMDIHFHSLLPVNRKEFKITADGDDQYQISFANVDGKQYTLPLVSNKAGVWKYGDDQDDLVFAEGSSAADHNIGMDDYLLLSNSRTGNDADKSVTHVVRYVDYDPADLIVTFESTSDHTMLHVPLSEQGIGYLIPGAHTYKLNVSDTTATAPNLSVDLDADSGYGDETKIVTYGGTIINLALNVSLNSTASLTLSDAGIGTIVGNGKTISGGTGFEDLDGSILLGAQVLAKKFDTPTTDEIYNWTITQESNDEIDLAFTSTGYDGPLNTDYTDPNYGFIFTEDDADKDHSKGLTDWGTLIDYYDDDDHPNTLTLSIPQTQQFTQLFITIGDVRHDMPPSAEKVNPISVGAAITDLEAPEAGTEHLIVVGGPCVNSVAARLMGDQEACTDGFTAGQGIIRVFDDAGKVAILVAGYDAQGTTGAARVLASYKKFALSGDEVIVDTADLAKLSIAPQ